MGYNNICIPHGLCFFFNTMYIYMITSKRPVTQGSTVTDLALVQSVLRHWELNTQSIYLHSETLQVLYKASLQLLLVFPCCEKQLQVSDSFCMLQ